MVSLMWTAALKMLLIFISSLKIIRLGEIQIG